MKKQVLVSVDRGETRVALLEATGAPAAAAAQPVRTQPRGGGRPKQGRRRPDWRVAELYFERRGNRSIVGNIYKGKVDNVLPGLEAAFVDIGLDKNGFLHVDEIVLPGVEVAAPRPRQGRRQEDRRPAQARPGGRRPGRQGPAEDQGRAPVDGPDHRRALHGLHADRRGHRRLQAPRRQGARAPAPRGQAASTCTAAARSSAPRPTAPSAQDFERELQYLFKLHEVLEKRVEEATAPELVFQEADLSVRVVRDIFSADFERAIVDDEKQHHRLVSFFTRTAPELVDRVELYQESTPLFEAYDVEKVIDGPDLARVDLPSRRLPDDRLRRGADRHRRQLRLVRRARQAGAPGGHDHAHEPRGGRGGRQPAAAARHRRDHRHRLHRHGAGRATATRCSRRCARRSTRTAPRRSPPRSPSSAWSR